MCGWISAAILSSTTNEHRKAGYVSGALARSPADVAIAITGVAGPDKDEDGNPVGLVCIAVARKSLPPSVFERNYGDIGRATPCASGR